MTKAEQLLLIGSLPPTRSHAALLTHSIAVAATECGIDVVCLIDTLAPPPTADLPYRVVRPFSEFLQSGAANNWPRLFVVGSNGDSLPVIETLHDAPGAVIAATHSLFEIALPWLQTCEGFPDNLANWLSGKYSEAGFIIATAYIHHRRQAKELGNEIPAFDLLLKSATSHLTLDPLQSLRLKDAGFTPTELAAPPLTKPANTQQPNSSLRISIIGADASTITAMSETLNASMVKHEQQIVYLDRYSEDTENSILASDAIIILDGHDAVWCPHFELATANGIPLITAGQRWGNILPDNARINLDYPASPTALVHAIAGLAAVDGLQAGLRLGLKCWYEGRAQSGAWIDVIQTAAATAQPAEFAKLNPPPPAAKAAKRIKAQKANTDLVSGIFALVGAVPVSPLLEQLCPDIDCEKCPRFLTPIIANTISTFMGIPASQMQDHMGFEAPLVADDGHNGSIDLLARKTKNWNDIKPGLRRAKRALAFGCTLDGKTCKPPKGGNICWSFKIPFEVLENPAITSAYEADSGIYWSHDPVRGALKCVILTGGSGVLKFGTTEHMSFVITDLSSTQTIGPTADCHFNVPDHGLGLFKIAALPTDDNNHTDMMNSLAQDGLLLEWSAT